MNPRPYVKSPKAALSLLQNCEIRVLDPLYDNGTTMTRGALRHDTKARPDQWYRVLPLCVDKIDDLPAVYKRLIVWRFQTPI